MRLSAEIFSADRGSTSVIVRSTEDREVYDTFTFRGAGHRTRASSMVSAVEGFQDARLDDMVEAVADATTGEFERLKEFGIRASSQGDKVALTFRGVTTTVASPHLQRVAGFIAGVGFDPLTISFRTAKRQRLTAAATDVLVKQALELRDRPIEAMCLAGPRPRVLWVRASGQRDLPSGRDRSEILRKQWARTLAILAE